MTITIHALSLSEENMATDLELRKLKQDRDFWKQQYEVQKGAYAQAWETIERMEQQKDSKDGFDLYEWLRQHILWSMETFGDGARTEGLCKHIAKELDEIRKEPNDIMEWADVIILACDGAWRAGYSAKEICLALQQKQQINQERQWVRTPENEPTEHTK